MKKLVCDSKGELKHLLASSGMLTHGRVDFCPTEALIQLAGICLKAGDSMRPHVHATPETWVIARGGLRVRLYDARGAFISEHILVAGDVLLTFGGGHRYLDAIEDTMLLEIKAGPYEGRTHVFFDESEVT
jgi:quercetin dioxygenase-like cupin family protein